MTVRLYNTATRSIEDFTPLHPTTVTMYNCGPTVYNYSHIGHMRAFIFADTLRRTLEISGHNVRQIMNITDVGHLVGDADEGEDKLEKGARREGKGVTEIVKMYSDAFFADVNALNIKTAEAYPRATEHIPEQIELIKILEEKGFTYPTKDGIYFDTAKFPDYGKMARLDINGLKEGARVESNHEKRSVTDFALWKFSPKDSARLQEWESPWGRGFPGWHIECSAMSHKYLGHPLDIHTGGIDHIPVHHTNEIAQSESAYGAPYSSFWMHNAHILIDGQKMSNSLGNTYTLKTLAEHHISPMAFRYWLLTAHYRTQVNFTWEALAGAENALKRLVGELASLPQSEPHTSLDQSSLGEFYSYLQNDLDTPRAIAHIWDFLKRSKSIPPSDRRITGIEMGKILGLNFLAYKEEKTEVTIELQNLLESRQVTREAKNFTESDRLRDEIKKLGYEVKDTPDGQVLSPL